MGLLTINGIELPISRDSLERGEIEIGSSGRAYSGAAWKSVRARKQTLSFTTAPMALADADAWSALLNGQAVNWDFESSTYSLQGHAATTSGTVGYSATQKKFGNHSLLMATGASASWSIGFGSSWSIAYWHYASSWAHVVKTSGGTTYVNGAASGSTYPGTISAGSVAFSAASTIYIDDLIALPAVVPASWPAQMYAHGAQLPASPSLTVAGDLLGQTLSMQARVTKRKPLETAAGVLWSLAVEMEEA